MAIRLALYSFLLAILFTANVLSAESFYQQTRKVSLLDINSVKVEIGELTFTDQGNGVYGFSFVPDYAVFTDYFLSMKEMKCLEGPELWCHIPYPHANPLIIEGDDYRWLEHKLIFMFKDKKSFGANFWNGIYYRLRAEGDSLIGTAQHVDLNVLAAPPEDLSLPPIGDVDLEEVDPATRWLPTLIIE